MSQEHIAKKLLRAQKQFTYEDDGYTCWCGEHILIDYFQFGVREMTARFNQWIDTHLATCTPQAMWKQQEAVQALTQGMEQ